jgi:hypothetical protein
MEEYAGCGHGKDRREAPQYPTTQPRADERMNNPRIARPAPNTALGCARPNANAIFSRMEKLSRPALLLVLYERSLFRELAM